jgi:hypothetical protein
MGGEQGSVPEAPAPGDPVRLLVIVRRGELARFELLREQLAEDNVRVIWDRRTNERRLGGESPEDRRRTERRHRAAPTWKTLDFTVVRESGG